jgi:hypothetical protein
LNTGACTVLCVATAPKKEKKQVTTSSGMASHSAVGA